MEEKELIEKLKSVSRINAEGTGYRARLRLALLNVHENIQKSRKISAFAWKIIPISALALMFLVFGFSQESTLILENINTISEAKQILEYDGQAKLLIDSGAIIGDTKIVGDRAYVIMQLPKKFTVESQMADKAITNAPMAIEALNYRQVDTEATDGELYLVEIDLISKRIIKIEEQKKQEVVVPE